MLHVTFQAENGEGGEGFVNLDELAQVADDYLTIDEVQTASDSVGQLLVKGIINGALDGGFVLQQLLEHLSGDILWQLVVEGIGSVVENIAEDAVVQLLLIVGLVGLLDIGNVAIVELQRTAHVAVDGRGA